MQALISIISIDVEKPYADAHKGIYAYMDIFDKLDIKATFFVTGDVVLEEPSIIHDIISQGHEIGSHGLYHPYINRPKNQRFAFLTEIPQSKRREYLSKSKENLIDLGVEPLGFRAPWLEIDNNTLQDVKKYFRYDSSLLNLPDLNIEIPEGLKELPISVLKVIKVPFSSSFYFGYVPKVISKALLPFDKSCPLVFYGHSFDFIKCTETLYTSLFKKKWYFNRCNSNQTRHMYQLLRFLIDKGYNFCTGAEYLNI